MAGRFVLEDVLLVVVQRFFHFGGQHRGQPFDIHPEEAAHDGGGGFGLGQAASHEVGDFLSGNLADGGLMGKVDVGQRPFQFGDGVNDAALVQYQAAAFQVARK